MRCVVSAMTIFLYKVGNNMEELRTNNASAKYITMRNGKAVRVKLGYSERHWNKECRKYDTLQELGFSMMRNFKFSDTYYVICNQVWFDVTKSDKDGSIVLKAHESSFNGMTEDTAALKKSIKTYSVGKVKSYLLDVQNFKTMKFDTLVEKFKAECIALEQRENKKAEATA